MISQISPFKIKIHAIRFVFLAAFFSTLIACNTEEKPKSTDTSQLSPPKVLSTRPAAGATGININTSIIVNFDTTIATVSADMITIYPMSMAMIIEKPIALSASSVENVLTIVPEVGALRALTLYQVQVSGVLAANGLAMNATCTWQFETAEIGTPVAMAQNSALVCSTSSIQGSPDAPQKVTAKLINDTTVEINWQAPKTGGLASYYQIEKSIDNNQTFTLLNDNVTATRFTDNEAITAVSHVYKITAGNAVALSSVSTLSNAVIPSTPIRSDKPLQLLQSQLAIVGNQFAYTLSYSPDGMILAVAEPTPMIGTAGLRSGNVQLFRKSDTAQPWAWFKTIRSKTPLQENHFGLELTFSSDSNSLAILEITEPLTFPRNRVHIYSKNNAWGWSQTLDLAGKDMLKTYGETIRFSPDGSTLAVSESAGNNIAGHFIGVVHLYTKKLGQWQVNQHLLSNTTGAYFEFGRSLQFSPDGSTLAVGEIKGDPNGTGEAIGSVQLFSKGTAWAWTTTLTSGSPAVDNDFGAEISFSSDGMTLAIAETFGDAVNAINAGTVQLFQKNASNWSALITLSAKTPVSDNQFGSAIAFSATGGYLVVGEPNGGTLNGGTVHVYRNSNGWAWSNNLLPEFPTFGNQFGAVLDINSNGTTLAVGDSLGDPFGKADAATTDSGTVNIYDLNLLP